MNRKQLQKMGVPPDCANAAIVALGRAADANRLRLGSQRESGGRGNRKG